MNVDSSVTQLPRIGIATAQHLAGLGIHTIRDVLYYAPFRYDDFGTLRSISELVPDTLAIVRGRIEEISAKTSPKKRMRMTEAYLNDGTDTIQIVWFNQPWIAKQLKEGQEITLSGRVAATPYGLQFQNPEIDRSNKTLKEPIQPVYHLTQKLNQRIVRDLARNSLEYAGSEVDAIPERIRKDYGLINLEQALRQVHFPASQEEISEAHRRFAFEELWLLQLKAEHIKKFVRTQKAAAQKRYDSEVASFVENLPFVLTDDQRKAAWQILQDLEQDRPMNRLLEGEVGSGKTVVAALAMYNTALNGRQSAFMAPTEVLARQHYATLTKFFSNQSLRIALLTNSNASLNGSGVDREEIFEALTKGSIDIIIGTHALITEKIRFRDLGLIVIDEQHRFGVAQRKEIKQKSMSKTAPHFLSMTATPIPRSLALVVYGELEMSALREMPKGRKPVTTKVVSKNQEKQVYSEIIKEIEQGRQVFVVCPLIDPSDKLGVDSATEVHTRLSKGALKNFSVGLIHGKLRPKEKERAMESFRRGETDVLVATAVIEVGVDVANATVMVIEGAERFGLAQLHQFRGRVGRSDVQSYCYLLASADISDHSLQRLQALEQSHNGFAIAEFDLKTRGPGEIYGIRQSGIPQLRFATFEDLALIEEAKRAAHEFLKNNSLDDFPLLKAKIQHELDMMHFE